MPDNHTYDMHAIRIIDAALHDFLEMQYRISLVCDYEPPEYYTALLEEGDYNRALLELIGCANQTHCDEVNTAITCSWLAYLRADILQNGVEAAMAAFVQMLAQTTDTGNRDTHSWNEMEELIRSLRT